MYHLNFWWFYSLHLVVEFHYQMQGRRRENNADKLEVFLSSFKVGEVCMFYSRVFPLALGSGRMGVNNARLKTVALGIRKTSSTRPARLDYKLLNEFIHCIYHSQWIHYEKSHWIKQRVKHGVEMFFLFFFAGITQDTGAFLFVLELAFVLGLWCCIVAHKWYLYLLRQKYLAR